MLRLPRATDAKISGYDRIGSPPGGSTLSTSAPRSASICVACGIGRQIDRSSTRMPSSSPAIAQVWVMTLRMTSPACIARNASFTSSRPIVAAHHVGDVEPAGLHEPDEAREVAPHLRRSVDAAEQLLLLVEEPEPTEGHLRVDARHPDDHDGPAAPRRRPRLVDGLGEADHLEGVVGTATPGERVHLRDRIPGCGVDEIGGAELLGGLALQLDGIHRDDPARPAMRAPWITA